MKNIFEKIITQLIKSLEELNINIKFKIVWAGFLRLGKITYMVSKLKKKFIFVEIHITRLDISFVKGD